MMNRLQALAETIKKYTDTVDGSILNNTGVIDIIIYYEYLLETNEAEIKYMSNIERKFEEQHIQEQLSEADYWDGDESINFLQ